MGENADPEWIVRGAVAATGVHNGWVRRCSRGQYDAATMPRAVPQAAGACVATARRGSNRPKAVQEGRGAQAQSIHEPAGNSWPPQEQRASERVDEAAGRGRAVLVLVRSRGFGGEGESLRLCVVGRQCANPRPSAAPVPNERHSRPAARIVAEAPIRSTQASVEPSWFSLHVRPSWSHRLLYPAPRHKPRRRGHNVAGTPGWNSKRVYERTRGDRL